MSDHPSQDQFFTPLEEAAAVLVSVGDYREAPLFELNGRVYARMAPNKFVRLMQHGHTSKPKVFWVDLKIPQPWSFVQGFLPVGAPSEPTRTLGVIR